MELAIDYLWVDSLCILQDSVKDWEAESAKMGECFKNAHVGIAASAASHA
ncbi:heterokaryon incompatibility protein [Fusarium oxysporum f. sp. phaseoli]